MSEMWFCTDCGKENQDNREFCSHCSKPKYQMSTARDTQQGATNSETSRANQVVSDIGLGTVTGLIIVSVLFLLGAIGLTIKGLYTLYDDSYSAKVVGGDAYNFIIYAGRGTALICAGIVSAVIGATLGIFALITNQKRHVNG